MRCSLVIAFASFVAASDVALAFEGDVHFGLTKWLALAAGFTPNQAEVIATGNQRVDSGDTPFLQLVTAYACLARDAQASSLVERYRYPSAVSVPAPSEQRVVVAGGAHARNAGMAATAVPARMAGSLLLKFGESLHVLQDSWAHQGNPDVPRPLGGTVACDPTLAWAHPALRGGWRSHKADLTPEWPADTMAMAKATYDLLHQYPMIDGIKRTPKPWVEIQPLLAGFIRAASKSEKKNWFVAQGIADVSFLQGITLPDGAEVFALQWEGTRLPPLPTLQSAQHRIDADLRDFYSRFFSQWIATDDFEALASSFGAPPPPSAKTTSRARTKSDSIARGEGEGAGESTATGARMSTAELAARLRVWRIRDHGLVADMAHASQPLTMSQRNRLLSIARNRDALALYTASNDAFYPLSVTGPEVQPILGFIITPIGASAAGNARAIATTKLRHVPHDTIVVLAERMEGRWRVLSLAATVDH